MKYFQELPLIDYPLPSGELIKATDLNIRYTFTDDVLSQPFAFYEYQWGDSDTPDKVAKMYYGDYDLAWLVMMSGQLFDWIEDLPVPQRFFQPYLEKKYGVPLEDLYTQVHHFEDENGFIVDEFSNGNPVFVFDYEETQNESKRVVKLISKRYLKDIKKEFREKLLAIREVV